MENFEALFEAYVNDTISPHSEELLMSMIASGNFNAQIERRIDEEIATALYHELAAANDHEMLCTAMGLTCQTKRFPRRRLAKRTSRSPRGSTPPCPNIVEENEGKILSVIKFGAGIVIACRKSYFEDDDYLSNRSHYREPWFHQEIILKVVVSRKHESYYFIPAPEWLYNTQWAPANRIETPLIAAEAGPVNLDLLASLIEKCHGVHVLFDKDLNSKDDTFMCDHNSSYIEILNNLAEKFFVICSPIGDAIKISEQAFQM